jgi:hypothetical protein
MADQRFSLRDSELDLPPVLPDVEELAERNRVAWLTAQQRLDPSPRVELARTFYRDALRARIRH